MMEGREVSTGQFCKVALQSQSNFEDPRDSETPEQT